MNKTVLCSKIILIIKELFVSPNFKLSVNKPDDQFLVSVIIWSVQPSISFPSLLHFSAYVWLLCWPLLEQRAMFSGADKQKLTHSSTKFTHSTLEENAKTLGLTEQQQQNQKGEDTGLSETSELRRREENRKEKALKLNLLVFHRQTLYTLLYMLTEEMF